MDIKVTFVRGFVGSVILATSLLPTAALAHDGKDSETILPSIVSTHLEARDGEDGSSINASTTSAIQHEIKSNDSDDDSNRNEDSNVKRHTDTERHSVSSKHDAEDSDITDGDDSEIEIDQDSAESATTTIDSPDHVATHLELRSFLNHIVKQDDRISDVHVSSSTIETHYEIPTKFLWSIPMSLTADVVMNTDGSVTVTYPWYAFLFATPDSDLSVRLPSASSTKGSTTSSANSQAHLLDLLFINLKSSTER